MKLAIPEQNLRMYAREVPRKIFDDLGSNPTNYDVERFASIREVRLPPHIERGSQRLVATAGSNWLRLDDDKTKTSPWYTAKLAVHLTLAGAVLGGNQEAVGYLEGGIRQTEELGNSWDSERGREYRQTLWVVVNSSTCIAEPLLRENEMTETVVPFDERSTGGPIHPEELNRLPAALQLLGDIATRAQAMMGCIDSARFWYKPPQTG